jgi:GlpG protein
LRQIGTLPKHLDPKALADYLLSLGMKTRIDERPEGWDVWIYNEDHLQKARDELEGYVRQPDDPRYRAAAPTADAIRRNERQLNKKFQKNYRDSSDLWGLPTFRQRPLSTLLIVVCVVVFLLQNIRPGRWGYVPTGVHLIHKLLFTTFTRDALNQVHDRGLSDIERGEVWRLFTPVLMHASPLHLVFNMLWVRYLGTLIEVRRGTPRLAILLLVSAAVSNYGQYIWMERIDDVAPFMGMSGVVYGLFGYVWMKGIYQPEQRMAVSSGNVNIMLVWLFACMTGVLGPIANAAHFVGLAVGIVFGLLGF